jgi:hypothetical protein
MTRVVGSARLVDRPISTTPASIATEQADSIARPTALTDTEFPSRLTPSAIPATGSAAAIGGRE